MSSVGTEARTTRSPSAYSRDAPEEVRADGAQATIRLASLAGVGLDRLEKVAIRLTLATTGGLYF